MERIHNAFKWLMGFSFGLAIGTFLLGTFMVVVPIAFGYPAPDLPIRTWALSVCFALFSGACFTIVMLTDR
jgi:alpha/beta superfamily hydrolase